MTPGQKNYLTQYNGELNVKFKQLEDLFGAYKTLIESANKSKTLIDKDFKKNLNTKKALKGSIDRIARKAQEISNFIKEKRSGREWAAQYTKSYLKLKQIEIVHGLEKLKKDSIERNNWEWVAEELLKVHKMIESESLIDVVYPEEMSYEEYQKKLKAIPAVYKTIKKSSGYKYYAENTGSSHCNGYNHYPWCCCGWGGPKGHKKFNPEDILVYA